MTGHTSTPWKIVSQHIEGKDGRTVQTEAYYPSHPPDDMKFLVHAVNCHDELLAAVKKYERQFRSYAEELGAIDCEELDIANDLLLTIAKAEAKP